MKKLLYLYLAVLLLIFFASCGSEKPASPETSIEKAAIDVDLSALSSTMAYSQLFCVYEAPEDYLDKRFKMTGSFAYYKDEVTENEYFACIVMDATACCAEGLEFVLKGSPSYPEDYPVPDSEVTISGVFESYTENGSTFYHLIDAEIEKQP